MDLRRRDLPAGSDCIGSDSHSHSIGTVRFGKDGNLLVSIGDGASYRSVDTLALRSQDLNRYEGKILRIDKDGGAPGDTGIGVDYLAVCDHVAIPADRAEAMSTTWYDTVATLGWLAGLGRLRLLDDRYATRLSGTGQLGRALRLLLPDAAFPARDELDPKRVFTNPSAERVLGP